MEAGIRGRRRCHRWGTGRRRRCGSGQRRRRLDKGRARAAMGRGKERRRGRGRENGRLGHRWEWRMHSIKLSSSGRPCAAQGRQHPPRLVEPRGGLHRRRAGQASRCHLPHGVAIPAPPSQTNPKLGAPPTSQRARHRCSHHPREVKSSGGRRSGGAGKVTGTGHTRRWSWEAGSHGWI